MFRGVGGYELRAARECRENSKENVRWRGLTSMGSDEKRDERKKETFFEFIRRAFGHDEILRSSRSGETGKEEEGAGSEAAANPEAGETAENQ